MPPRGYAKTCVECGSEFIPDPSRGPKYWTARRFCGRQCASTSSARKGTEANRKPPGTHKPTFRNGYILDWVPGRKQRTGSSLKARGVFVYRHRLVMEQALGRELGPGEIVHHRNGDRLDNRLENLELTTPSDHQREHVAARVAAGVRSVHSFGIPGPRAWLAKPPVPCAYCGKHFKQQGTSIKCCSQSCGQKLRFSK